MKYASLAERLIANSVLSDELFHEGTPCWIWLGKRRQSRGGLEYGALTMRYKSGPRKGKPYNVSAHRAAITAFHKGKRITPKTVVRHLCNNSLCINPPHLKGGTASQNMQDCVTTGRHKTPFRDPEKKRAL